MISQIRISDSLRTRLPGMFSISSTVRMYYVYVYVAVILLQICSGPCAVQLMQIKSPVRKDCLKLK